MISNFFLLNFSLYLIQFCDFNVRMLYDIIIFVALCCSLCFILTFIWVLCFYCVFVAYLKIGLTAPKGKIKRIRFYSSSEPKSFICFFLLKRKNSKQSRNEQMRLYCEIKKKKKKATRWIIIYIHRFFFVHFHSVKAKK